MLAADIIGEACRMLYSYDTPHETSAPKSSSVVITARGRRVLELRGRFKRIPLLILQNTDMTYPGCAPITTHHVHRGKCVTIEPDEEIETWRTKAMQALRAHINVYCTTTDTRKMGLVEFYEQNQHRLVGKTVHVRAWGEVKITAVIFAVDNPHPVLTFHDPEKGTVSITFSEITSIRELVY